MDTITNALAYAPPPTPQSTKRTDAPKSGAGSSAAGQPPQTDSYDRTNRNEYIPPPKGAVRYGEGWLWPPDALTRTDRQSDKLLSKTEISLSSKGAVAGNGGAAASDAAFKGVLTREAVEYSDLEKRIHNLLGYTLETFKTTFKAEGKLSAWASLMDGTFFSSAFSGFAASYSISSKYSFDDSFRAQYNASPSRAVEYNFDSLRAMMESVVLRQGEDGNATASFSVNSRTMQTGNPVERSNMIPYLSDPLARNPSPEWESSIWAENMRQYEETRQ